MHCTARSTGALTIHAATWADRTTGRRLAGTIPATGNFFYAESDGANCRWVSRASKRLYTPLDSVIELGGPWPSTGNLLQIAVHGDEEWRGELRTDEHAVGPEGRVLRQPAVLPNVQSSTGRAGSVAEGRSGAGGNGWVVIDSVTYSGNQLQSITLRFAQWSAWAPENGTLHGMVRWSADGAPTHATAESAPRRDLGVRRPGPRRLAGTTSPRKASRVT